MNSYGIRCIFEHTPRHYNTLAHLYEERITVWVAESIDDALDLASTEAHKYCENDEFVEFTGLSQAFWMFEPIESHGAEVFSLMRESNLEQEAYLNHFFSTGDERQQRSDVGR